MAEEKFEAGKKEDTSVGSQRAQAPKVFEEGFTWYSVAGAFFVGFIMMPASIYLSLLLGIGMGSAAQWVTVILFMEIVRRSFGKMKKQEMYILLYIAGGLIGGGPFGGFIWNQYFFQSGIAQSFGIIDSLKAEGVRWIAPFPGSEAYLKRTFMHKDWVKPILLMLGLAVLGKLNWFGGGYLAFRITSDIEKLPFPLAAVGAEGATALADASVGKRETWRWNIFSIGSMIGVVFGFFYVFIPAFTGAVLNSSIQLLPIPFIDLTPNLAGILPASLWGLNTELGGVLAGFVIPFPIIIGQFIATMASQIIVNPLLFKGHILTEWVPGMGSIQTSMVNSMNFWMSAGIGVALFIAVIGMASAWKSLTGNKGGVKMWSVFKEKIDGVPGRGDFPLWVAAAMWLFSMCMFSYIAHRLVPSFPFVFILFFAFVWSPLDTYVSARMRGLTSTQDWGVPFVKEGIFMYSTKMGYHGVAIWYAPMPLTDQGVTSQFFREVELTGTKFTSIIKAELLMFPIILFTSFIFWSLIWKLGPIPSATYPYVNKFWPLNATFQCVWNTGTLEGGTNYVLKAITIPKIIWGAGIAGGLFTLVNVFNLPILFFYGLVSGLNGWPHGAIPLLIGGLLSRYYFAKKYGKDKWLSYAAVLLAGYYCGMGLIGMAGIAVSFISKSVYQLPF